VLAGQIDWQSFEDAFAPLYCPDNGCPAKHRSKALRADRKVRTIAGRLVREAEMNLPPGNPHHAELALYRRVLAQRRQDSDKVYSLQEPDVKCVSKGKDHKKYEFGRGGEPQQGLADRDREAGCVPCRGIVGALSLGNPCDGYTLPAVIEQYESIFGRAPSEITVDRGYRGRTKIGQTTINIPKPFNDKNLSRHRQNKLRRRHPTQGLPRFLSAVPPRGVAGTALFV